MRVDPPTFRTERLILRGVTEADAPAIQRNFADYEVVRYLSRRVPWPYPENGAEEYLKKAVLPNQGRDRWVWGLFLKCHPDELIGIVDLWRPGRPENRGFWLGRRYWARGLMSEALVPVTDWAFEGLGFEVLILNNAKGNVRSRRIKERSGARLLRVEPGEYVDPSFTETELWELPIESWRALRIRAESDADA